METELEQKLKKFYGTVLKDAEVQRDEIEKEITREREANKAAKEDEFLADAYMTIQKNITRIQKEDNEKVLHAELEARKDLLKKREQIIDDVFAEAETKIREYMKTSEYKKALAEKISAAIGELGEGAKTVNLVEQDKDVFDADCGAKLVCVPDKEFIGGVKVINEDKDIAVDYSYYELLCAQRDEFLQKSGLSLS